MPSKATDVTVETAHASPSASREPQDAQSEDMRVLSNDSNIDAAAATSHPLTPDPYSQPQHAARTFSIRNTLNRLQQGNGSYHYHPRVEQDVSAASPIDSVASPPFFPTGRHHSFFMDDLDSRAETEEGSPVSSASPASAAVPNAPMAVSGGDAAAANGAPQSVTVNGSEARRSPFLLRVDPGGSGVATTTTTGAALPAATSLTPVTSEAGVPMASKQLLVQPGASVPTMPTQEAPRRRKHRHRLVAKAPPFDPARPQQWNLLTLAPDPDLPLYPFEEIPHWQKYNPYVRRGYRAFYTARMCFKSMLGWHNETINVYSHFVTFLVFVIFTVLLYVTVLNKAISAPSMGSAKLMYAIFCFGSMACMLNSSIYHLFNCHSHQRVMTAMGRLDFLGITILIVASFLPPLYVMFHCYTTWRAVYISTILVLGTAGIVGPWTDAFHEHVGLRVGIFLGIGFSGMVPAFHSVFLISFTSSTYSIVVGIFLMVFLYCLGVVFYVSQFPESRYPGYFDFWLSSHQIWHFFVSMAALVHYFNCVSLYQLWKISDGICG